MKNLNRLSRFLNLYLVKLKVMTYKYIQTENYLLVVDDSEIKEGDWTYHHIKGVYRAVVDGAYTNQKKIIAHLPLNNAPILEGVDLLPPLENEAEKLANELWKASDDRTGSAPYIYSLGIEHGYNKAKEKYKYTEEDMIDFAIWRNNTFFDSPYTPLGELRLWQSLQQPKIPIGFECDMKQKSVNGSIPVNQVWEYEPKTKTNSQGLTQWVGKHIFTS